MLNMNKLFDCIEKLAKVIKYYTVFLLMYILNPGHSYKEIEGEQLIYKKQPKEQHDIYNGEDADTIMEIATAIYQEELTRGQNIDEKYKVLLTIATLLLAATAILASFLEPKWLILLPLLPIMTSIYLVLVHFGIQKFNVPDRKEALKNRKAENAKLALAKDLIKCSDLMEPKNAFRVGIYLTAARAMTLGAVLLIVPFLVFSFSPSPEQELIEQIKKDKYLQEILRGPKGERGDAGPRGHKGDQGPPSIFEPEINQELGQIQNDKPKNSEEVIHKSQ